MKMTIKKTLSFLLALCMLLCFTACDEGSSTGIYELTIASLDNKEFFSGKTYEDLKLEVDNTLEYETEDVNVVVKDPSIIDITFEKKETLFSKYISFDIVCKSVGTTSFYFETSDKVVKSEEVEISVLSNIKSIKFSSTDDITIYDFESDETLSFDVEYNEYVSDYEKILDFVSENPEIVTIKYDTDSWFGESCIIEKVNAGETYIYIQTKDKTVQSKKIKVIVEAEEAEEEETNSPVYEETPVDNSRTVYTTPYGKKYHYSKSCAGSNASATTEDAVKGIYDPCKKCAQ